MGLLKTCALCGTEYDMTLQSDDRGFQITRYENSKYCSRDCFHEARRRAALLRKQTDSKVCEQCGKHYGRNGRKPNQFAKSRYCSIECSSLSQRNSLDNIRRKIAIDPVTDCHVWTGAKYGKGYGQTAVNGRMTPVHRYMWTYFKGEIPTGLQIDHLCQNKACCNVNHLRLVTAQENTLASDNMAARHARQTCCPKCGGEYSFFPNGTRYCKPCRHEASMNYQRWRRAEIKAGKSGMKRDTGET